MQAYHNKNFLITGGASGIGIIMAKLYLQLNSKVIIWDINQRALEDTVKELRSFGKIAAYQVDLSKVDEIEQMAQ